MKHALNKTTEAFDYAIMHTAWGEYIAVASSEGLCWLMKTQLKQKPALQILEDHFPNASLTENKNSLILKKTEAMLNQFIAGNPVDLNSLPLDLRGTDFQQNAWAKIASISSGDTLSYKEIAKAAGNENAVRAAGSACGKNPIPYLIPCHRVIGHGGNLGGFTWGLDEKRYLLKREQPNVWPDEWAALKQAV